MKIILRDCKSTACWGLAVLDEKPLSSHQFQMLIGGIGVGGGANMLKKCPAQGNKQMNKIFRSLLVVNIVLLSICI